MMTTLIRELVVERRRSAEACNASLALGAAVESACARSRQLCDEVRRRRTMRLEARASRELGESREFRESRDTAALLAATLDELDVLNALDLLDRYRHPAADEAWDRIAARAHDDLRPAELHELAESLRALVRELHDELAPSPRAAAPRFRPPLARS